MCRCNCRIDQDVPVWVNYLLWFQAERLYEFQQELTEIQSAAQRNHKAVMNKLGEIMSEQQDAVDAITAQVQKGTAEVVAQVAKLEEQIANGEAPDLTGLKAAAQALDDLNADPEPAQPTE